MRKRQWCWFCCRDWAAFSRVWLGLLCLMTSLDFVLHRDGWSHSVLLMHGLELASDVMNDNQHGTIREVFLTLLSLSLNWTSEKSKERRRRRRHIRSERSVWGGGGRIFVQQENIIGWDLLLTRGGWVMGNCTKPSRKDKIKKVRVLCLIFVFYQSLMLSLALANWLLQILVLWLITKSSRQL